jgi:hypothetical protein
VSLAHAQVSAANDVSVSANGISLSDDANGPTLLATNTGLVNLTSTADKCDE